MRFLQNAQAAAAALRHSSRGRTRILGAVSASALATVAGLALATPATAAPYETGTFHDTWEEPFECDGVTFDSHWDWQARYRLIAHGADQLPYYLEVVTTTTVLTNPETGESITRTNDGLYVKDRTITDNGDGTFTLTGMSPSHLTVVDDNGTLLARSGGLQSWGAIIDNGGTPTDASDDEFAELLWIDYVGYDSYSPAGGLCGIALATLT